MDETDMIYRPMSDEEKRAIAKALMQVMKEHPELWQDKVADKITDRIVARPH